MDFKVAGTEHGITALLLDIKMQGIKPNLLSEALSQARQARLTILAKMAETISFSRLTQPLCTSGHRAQIDVESWRFIGPGGRNSGLSSRRQDTSSSRTTAA
jgi:polyribonucleotide nucleotidyltransferase